MKNFIKKTICVAAITGISISAWAQGGRTTIAMGSKFAEKTMTNTCASPSESKSIASVLSKGKGLIIFYEGSNCGECRAPQWAEFQKKNGDVYDFWLALTMAGSGNPNCNLLNEWMTTFKWTNVWGFLDINRDFAINSWDTPGYVIIDPQGNIQNSGQNFDATVKKADELAKKIRQQPTVVLLAETVTSNLVFPNPTSEIVTIVLALKQEADVAITISDVMGKEIMKIANGNMSEFRQTVNVSALSKGVYHIDYLIDGKKSPSKILMIQ